MLSELKKNLLASAPFSVDFQQEMMNDGVLELSERGTFLFKSPEKMKWAYENPEIKVFILKDKTINIYLPMENQLMIGDVTSQKEKWLWQVLVSENPDIEILPFPKERRIELNQVEQNIKMRIFIGQDGLPEKVIQVDSLGYEQHFRFKSYRRRIDIDEREFHLDVPKGVEIIELE